MIVLRTGCICRFFRKQSGPTYVHSPLPGVLQYKLTFVCCYSIFNIEYDEHLHRKLQKLLTMLLRTSPKNPIISRASKAISSGSKPRLSYSRQIDFDHKSSPVDFVKMSLFRAKEFDTASEWAFERKMELNPWLTEQDASVWQPARLTGRLKWRHNSTTNLMQQARKMDHEEDEARPQCGKQFAMYCDYTTMHGIRYVGEPQRTIGEKIFWGTCVVCMMSLCIYMMRSIYLRWESSPVITSVSNTNFPVTNVNFPAVTVCTVNKAVNEKLVIQACRYNLTLSEIQTIISRLVDPEGRNNENTPLENPVHPKVAIKYLRLAAPKCDDYLLTCRWNSASIKCANLFKLTLTDSGYCCSFNAIPQSYRKSDPKNDAEVLEQEHEFEHLQKAVWDYIDSWTEKNGPAVPTGETPTTNSTSYACNRTYTDALFPGICKHLDKCRKDPKGCNLEPTEYTPKPEIQYPAEFPYKAAGAGRSRGLVLMLDTLRCEAVPTDSFKGLRVFVHDPDEFPAVNERGFIVAPGYENQIAVIGNDIYSEEVLRNFAPDRRGCYFTDEFPLKFYKDYSRSSCVIECETEFVAAQCGCTPYYSPGNYTTCTTEKVNGCVRKALDVIQKKTIITESSAAGGGNERPSLAGKDRFSFSNKGQAQESRSCMDYCLPACYETSYGTVVTSAPFPNQPEPNKTKMIREAISFGRYLLNDIGYVENSVSVLRVFFRQSSVVQFKRDEMFAWEDFVSNLGGVMGLCLGFSILSIIEVIYFFTIRFCIDNFRYSHRKDSKAKMKAAKKVHHDSWADLKF